MFIYLNEIELAADNMLTLRADSILEVEENESFIVPYPTIWDDQILRSINIDEYDIYYICTHSCRFGQYNRVTDFKKVWKLENIPSGIKDGFYDVDEGRVYWGVYKTHGEKGFRMHLSSTTILSLRSSQSQDLDLIYKFWKEKRLGFNKPLSDQLINDLGLLVNDSYVLHYNGSYSTPILKIYGSNANSVFASRNGIES